MKITKEQLKQIIKEELGGDYGVAMQMINKFNNQTHFGDVEADLQEDEDGTILYRVVISMGTKEIENLGSQVGLERNIQSKINQLQSELSTRVDVFGDTIQIELQPKVQGIENLQSFLNDASLLSHEIVGGDVAQSDLSGVKESKLKITKEQLKQIIKEEVALLVEVDGPGRRSQLAQDIAAHHARRGTTPQRSPFRDEDLRRAKGEPSAEDPEAKTMETLMEALQELLEKWPACKDEPGGMACRYHKDLEEVIIEYGGLGCGPGAHDGIPRELREE